MGPGCWVELTLARRSAMATCVVTLNDILEGHVGLDSQCFDRIYLNGWVPNLHVSGQWSILFPHHLAHGHNVYGWSTEDVPSVVDFRRRSDDRQAAIRSLLLPARNRSGTAPGRAAAHLQNRGHAHRRPGDAAR